MKSISRIFSRFFEGGEIETHREKSAYKAIAKNNAFYSSHFRFAHICNFLSQNNNEIQYISIFKKSFD